VHLTIAWTSRFPNVMRSAQKDYLTRSNQLTKLLTHERGVRMTSYDGGATWFLAQLRPNCGHIASRSLARQGFQTFLPMEDSTRRVKDKFVHTPRPLFPGYIFVGFSAGAGHWRAVNSTYGVTRLVSFGQEPAPVPLEIVSQLMSRCDASGKLLPPKLLRPGDRVSLTSGPLANFVAEVERIAPDRRVWVLMDIMGGQTRVAVAADQLRTI
jgi:transcriptional antiterminator RfaH